MTHADTELLLSNLNPAQREAVTIVDGPVLVVAGAGSGKTRVITYRIPYLLLTGAAYPGQILALTFTNKAAGEMKARAAALAGAAFRPPQISTFHSFGAQFLRRHIEALGYSRDFLIYDEDDQLGMVKECCRQLNLSEARYNPRDVQHFVKWSKMQAESAEIYDPNIKNVIDLYSRKLRASRAVDFDDLLLLPLRILRENGQILHRYLEAFHFIMVDEYQDTNEVQYELLKTLAGPRANVLVVGDEDQSIYRFRGAKPENISQFMRDYPQHRLVKLEQNYRSTKTIIKAAQAVISRNSTRVKKELWTDNTPGEPIEVYHATDEYDEATFVTLRVMAALKDVSPSQIAVLYRANAQSRALEESFLKAQIPHRIVGAVSFYERREVRDALAYLRLLANPADAASFFRVVNVPPRGVGKKMVQQVQEESVRTESSPYETAAKLGGPALRSFLALFQPSLHQQTPSTFLEELLERIGYADYLRKDDPQTAQDRLENIAEFLGFLREREVEPEFNLLEFLGSLPLDSGTRQEAGEAVTLLTVHSAKGLEFRLLFVVGLEEGLFPHIRSLESAEDVEEERRLFYVAMTRAKERLQLCWAQSRGMFGSRGSSRPSRFLEEIPDWFKVQRISERFGAPVPSRAESVPSSRASTQDPSSPFRVGGVVHHDKLGRGTVMNVDGAPGDWKLTIRFPTGVKKILTKYAQLTVE